MTKFNDKKTEDSCKLAAHLLFRYLNSHRVCEIVFPGSKLEYLHGFSDEDSWSDVTIQNSDGHITALTSRKRGIESQVEISAFMYIYISISID